MRQPYFKLIFWLLLGAVVTFAVGLSLLNISQTADVDAEVGKWLLTVTAALVFTGALSLVLKQIDERRGERQRWYGVLNDLGAANHTIGMLRLYLAAEQSALTYMEQLAELVRARQELRRISTIDIVMADRQLLKHINAMQQYLEALGQECEVGYLHVARQQRLDEVWLTDRMKAASESADAPVLPDGLAKPTKAWDMLTDKARFPQLAALLDDYAFQIDAFCIHYELAKRRLEKRAGFADGSTDASAYWARKLPGLAMEFLKRHKDDLAEDVRTRVKDAACKVENDCAGTDPSAIQEATVKLCKATADAISAIYPSPKYKGH
jgi:hypothetical protein